MRRESLPEMNDYLARNRRRRIWKKVVGCLACLVVLCTICSMISPALTMEVIGCGKEEHRHTEECYTQLDTARTIAPSCSPESLEIHHHVKDCDAEAQGTQVCGYADFVVHTHDKACHDPDGTLWCTLPEIKVHTHGEICYTWPYEPDPANPMPGEPQLICEKEEIALHEHTDKCWDADGNWICGEQQVLEHIHTADCFPAEKTLVCGKEEHTHTSECKTLKTEELDPPATQPVPEEGITPPTQPAPETDVPKPELPSETVGEEGSLTEARHEPVEIAAVPEGTIDFTNFITGATVQYKEAGEPEETPWTDVVNGGTIPKDAQLRFDLKYTLPVGTLDSAHKTIAYQLPPDVKLAGPTGGTLKDNFGKPIGEYTISAEGLIQITFNDDYVELNQSQEIGGDIWVESYAEYNGSGEGNKHEIDFGPGVKVEYTVVDTEPTSGDIGVRKYSNRNDGDAPGEASYTIEISSEFGTGGPVTLEDVMKLLGCPEGTFDVSNIQVTGDGIVTGDGTVESNYTVTETADGFTVVLPKMEPGTKYTITYKVKTDPNSDAVWQYDLENKAKVTSEDKSGTPLTDTITVSDHFWDNPTINKAGAWNEKTGQVDWLVTVNPEKRDISGCVLRDELNGEPFAGPVVLIDSAGNETTITLPYTFPEGSTDTYTIRYSTPRPIAQERVNNTISLENRYGTTIQGTAGTIVPMFNPFFKEGNSVVDNGDGTVTIEWTYSINASDSIPAPWEFKDQLVCEWEDPFIQYFTEAQIQEAQAAFMAAFAEYGPTDFQIRQEGLNWNGELTNKTTGFSARITKPIPAGTKLSFTYHSTAELKDPNAAQTLKNRAYYGEHSVEASVVKESKEPLISKIDPDYPDKPESNHNWSDSYDPSGAPGFRDPITGEYLREMPAGYLFWEFQVTLPEGYNGGPLTVTEQLPEGVTFAEISMLLNGYKTPITFEYDTWIGGGSLHAEKNGQTITLVLPDGVVGYIMTNYATPRQAHFYVTVKINDDCEWILENGRPHQSFTNSVEVRSEDGKTVGSDQQTQHVILDDPGDGLVKSGTLKGDNIIHYTVTVDPEALTYIPASLKRVTLVDTAELAYRYAGADKCNISLVPDSVKVYKLVNGVKGEQFDPAEVPYMFTTEQIEVGGDEYRYILKVSLPVEPLVVEYDYKTSAPNATQINISNSARLVGNDYDSGEEKNETEFWYVQSGASASGTAIIVKKVDLDNFTHVLPGAKFQLYRYFKDGLEGGYEPVYDWIDGVQSPVYFTSDENGEMLLENLTYNTAYYLKEITAPDGFLLRDEPYYFYLYNSNTTQYPEYKPSDFVGRVCVPGETIYLPNESEKTSITVDKWWLSTTGEDISATMADSEIQFKLYQTEVAEPVQEVSCTVDVEEMWIVNPERTLTGTFAVGDTITLTLSTSSPIPEWFSPYVELWINGSRADMVWLPETAEYTYTFVITEDTKITISVSQEGFLVANGGFNSWSVVPAPRPDPGVVTDMGTYTLNAANGWSMTISNLLRGYNMEDGSICRYAYYVEEITTGDFRPEYVNNGGINSGTITIKNIEKEIHTLPETGGTGTSPYTIGGLLILSAGSLLLYSKKKRGKEDFTPF